MLLYGILPLIQSFVPIPLAAHLSLYVAAMRVCFLLLFVSQIFFSLCCDDKVLHNTQHRMLLGV